MEPSQITIVRSRRRKKTIQTKYGDGHLWIYLPAGMNPKDEQKWIDRMIERNNRSERKKKVKESDSWLVQHTEELNKKYFNGALTFSIRFVTNQNSRYGSCTSIDKTIRISDRVKTMPSWVQDYIIIHELTHLIYPDHSKNFWEKVNQYRYAERAKGYLIAIGAGTIDGETEPSELENVIS
ncbi:MAG TPA: metal-dependent hydrolase [Thermoplasmata archaeon]|jgi:predicted metal-dependent hydrolase|nr:MAG TPA: metal-dependent hydrolase [Thermoplasmata archaeon]